MNKLYCSNTSCAKVNYYESAKPKFCAHCGQPFGGGFSFATASVPSPIPVQKRATAPTFQMGIREENDDEGGDIARLGGFKIGVANLGKKVTLGDIQNGGAVVPDQDRPRGNDLDAKKVRQETRQKFIKQQVNPTEVTE